MRFNYRHDLLHLPLTTWAAIWYLVLSVDLLELPLARWVTIQYLVPFVCLFVCPSLTFWQAWIGLVFGTVVGYGPGMEPIDLGLKTQGLKSWTSAEFNALIGSHHALMICTHLWLVNNDGGCGFWRALLISNSCSEAKGKGSAATLSN